MNKLVQFRNVLKAGYNQGYKATTTIRVFKNLTTRANNNTRSAYVLNSFLRHVRALQKNKPA